MLYIVQMITSGTASHPKAFANQAQAQKAFTDLVREHCEEGFAEYCARIGADPASFSTAKAFADAGSRGELTVHYWELSLEEEEEKTIRSQQPSPSRKPVLKAAAETQQQVLGVQAELRGLTEKLAGMSQELIRLQDLLGDESDEAAEVSDAPELSQPEPEPLDDKYQTAEWQDFVQSLIQMCGGNFGEFPLISRQDWRHAVYSNQTTLQYWEWVAMTIDQSIERAKAGGYAVEADREQAGHFAYLTPTGERSSTLYELEDLAWCAAGLHAAQEDGANDEKSHTS